MVITNWRLTKVRDRLRVDGSQGQRDTPKCKEPLSSFELILGDSVPELLLALHVRVQRKQSNSACTQGQEGGSSPEAKKVGPDVTSADPTCTLEGVLTMLDHTTNPNLRKTLRDLLIRVLSAIGSRIFWADDHRARERGWQITPRYSGLSRTYRDPRFNHLIPCPACNGRGYNSDRATCSDCRGSGRLVLDRAQTTQPGRVQQEAGQP